MSRRRAVKSSNHDEQKESISQKRRITSFLPGAPSPSIAKPRAFDPVPCFFFRQIPSNIPAAPRAEVMKSKNRTAPAPG
jgi:hypothetical protein